MRRFGVASVAPLHLRSYQGWVRVPAVRDDGPRNGKPTTGAPACARTVWSSQGGGLSLLVTEYGSTDVLAADRVVLEGWG